jgi:hypothetical protein
VAVNSGKLACKTKRLNREQEAASLELLIELLLDIKTSSLADKL